MGTVISKAANGVGALLGSAFIAPFKTLLGSTCEDVCLGTWDVICFVEHLCIASLLKLLMVLGLAYAMLVFFYLLFKVGIIQCIIRGCCKMSWSACEAYCSALEGICCLLWLKLKNTKRVHRGRMDTEEGFSPSEDADSSYGDDSLRVSRKQQPLRDKRKHHMSRSLNPVRHRSFNKRNGRVNHHHVKLTSNVVSVHSKKGLRSPFNRHASIQNKLVVKRRRMH